VDALLRTFDGAAFVTSSTLSFGFPDGAAGQMPGQDRPAVICDVQLPPFARPALTLRES
jgi:hypothetical protein